MQYGSARLRPYLPFQASDKGIQLFRKSLRFHFGCSVLRCFEVGQQSMGLIYQDLVYSFFAESLIHFCGCQGASLDSQFVPDVLAQELGCGTSSLTRIRRTGGELLETDAKAPRCVMSSPQTMVRGKSIPAIVGELPSPKLLRVDIGSKSVRLHFSLPSML